MCSQNRCCGTLTQLPLELLELIVDFLGCNNLGPTCQRLWDDGLGTKFVTSKTYQEAYRRYVQPSTADLDPTTPKVITLKRCWEELLLSDEKLAELLSSLTCLTHLTLRLWWPQVPPLINKLQLRSLWLEVNQANVTSLCDVLTTTKVPALHTLILWLYKCRATDTDGEQLVEACSCLVPQLKHFTLSWSATPAISDKTGCTLATMLKECGTRLQSVELQFWDTRMETCTAVAIVSALEWLHKNCVLREVSLDFSKFSDPPRFRWAGCTVWKDIQSSVLSPISRLVTGLSSRHGCRLTWVAPPQNKRDKKPNNVQARKPLTNK
eukprot:TRINITY_DN60148_c0_g1_i1.p1 TRINITY_DN60148_c0_g1~~TRINITY_DN60148_c0_g1_i1.p1  ORF type:complete len:323 (+),score=10.49 TRINITY_DN60148_c0_g1_i1:45-1013(+)